MICGECLSLDYSNPKPRVDGRIFLVAAVALFTVTPISPEALAGWAETWQTLISVLRPSFTLISA